MAATDNHRNFAGGRNIAHGRTMMAPTVTSDAASKLRFASLPCSRFPASLAAHPSLPVAAYVSSNNLVLLSCLSYTVVDVLPIRDAPLNAVAFAPEFCPQPSSSDTASPLLFAAGADGHVSLCSTSSSSCSSSQPASLEIRNSMAIHDSSCLAMDVVELCGLPLSITVSATQLTATLLHTPWTDPSRCTRASYDLQTRPDGPTLLPHTIAAYTNDDTLVFMALAGTDKKIHIFSLSVQMHNSQNGADTDSSNGQQHDCASSIDIRPLKRISAHRDWVRGLAWAADKNGMPLLASASSDATVRLFRVAPMQADDPPHPLYLQFELESNKDHSDSVATWAVRSLCLMDEHSSTVHCVRFGMSCKRMLSASLDGTVAVWDISDPEFPALCARFGLLGGHSIHATGFFSVTFVHHKSEGGLDDFENGTTNVLAAGFSGAVHRWRAPIDVNATFTALPGVSGHSAAVRQVTWAPDGSFLLSASDDKSVRAFVNTVDGEFVEWARPQVHGHAIASVAFCNLEGTRYVSAAEERMLRLFDAPESFRLPEDDRAAAGPRTRRRGAVARAKLPELGLSNKAVFSTFTDCYDGDDDDEDKAHGNGGFGNGVSASAALQNGNGNGNNVNAETTTEGPDAADDMRVTLTGSARGAGTVPLEEELKQETLWPETAKLYGHGNEVVRVTTDPKSGLIASACHAQNGRDASIIVWDGGTGSEVARLDAHDLSVTDLRFSADGQWLASVSRDRALAVSRRLLPSVRWRIVARLKAAHTRVVFSCAWLSDTTTGNQYVVTAGRDKCLRVFRVNVDDTIINDDIDDEFEYDNDRIVEVAKLKFDTAVTAVDCCPYALGNERLFAVAVGFESGDFCIVRAALDANSDGEVQLHEKFRAQERMRCGSRVTSVQWRPRSTVISESGNLDLALGSEDMSVRIYKVRLAECWDTGST